MKIIKIIWAIPGVLYFPIYMTFVLLHIVARLLLAIAYFGIFEWKIGKDIILNLFNRHGKH